MPKQAPKGTVPLREQQESITGFLIRVVPIDADRLATEVFGNRRPVPRLYDADGDEHMDVTVAITLANAACRNARALEQDARDLLERGSIGRATALAIIGLEECGKARTLAQDAIGEWSGSDKSLEKTLLDHKSKQLSGALPRDLIRELLETIGIEKLAAALAPILEEVERDPSSFDARHVRERMERALVELSAPHSERLEQLGARIRTAYQQRRQLIVDHNQLQRLKHRGLYVDWDDSQQVADGPNALTQEDARKQLSDLSEMLVETEEYLASLGSADEVQKLRAMMDLFRAARE